MVTLKVSEVMSDKEANKLEGKFLDESYIKTLITESVDVYDNYGNVLMKFRKDVIPFNLLHVGYVSFRDAVESTESRGITSGSSGKRIKKDGTKSNITVGAFVDSGVVGYLDPFAMIPYCRKTAFTAAYFDKFNTGIPFVKKVDELYKELCPFHYARQINIANGTDINYRIADTSFTTVTVNKNFQTAVHKDQGDFKPGFGNLIAYREGSFDGCYFCLPQYGIGVELQNTDILFVDVHQWHGNTPFRNCSPDYLRMSFVLYYREYMVNCKKPSEELADIKRRKGGFEML